MYIANNFKFYYCQCDPVVSNCHEIVYLLGLSPSVFGPLTLSAICRLPIVFNTSFLALQFKHLFFMNLMSSSSLSSLSNFGSLSFETTTGTCCCCCCCCCCLPHCCCFDVDGAPTGVLSA